MLSDFEALQPTELPFGDPLSRLVLADWLEERGDPRGALLRLWVDSWGELRAEFDYGCDDRTLQQALLENKDHESDRLMAVSAYCLACGKASSRTRHTDLMDNLILLAERYALGLVSFTDAKLMFERPIDGVQVTADLHLHRNTALRVSGQTKRGCVAMSRCPRWPEIKSALDNLATAPTKETPQ